MKISRHLSALLFLSLLTISSVNALGAPRIFANIRVPQWAKLPDEEDLAKKREAEITDSLLNSIEVDSITRAVYEMYPPRIFAPRILGSKNEPQFYTMEVEPLNYQQNVGVVYYDGEESKIMYPSPSPAIMDDPIPVWLEKYIRFQNQIYDANLALMMADPSMIEYTDWNLPVPPRLPKEDFSFHSYLKRQNFTLIEDTPIEDIPEVEIPKRHWLHTFNVALQLSQAYVSPSWYQGGNSYVSGLFNFAWNVDLNTVYHPNLLFQSAVSYKLAVNSNPKGSLHKYNTSQDLFQYNLKTGLKAFNNHWFYSLNLLFNTQFFNAYPEDSMQRTSTLLSPGTLNIGVGMTYTLEKKGANFTVSISPLAYNLKTCIASDIDHLQFNIEQNRKTRSEIGSSAEANLLWKFNDNISWKSRLFLFTDYSYFLADWENTFNFQLNKFLSTQIYLHPRFDSSSEEVTKWRHWMFREILSFGISYTFATPK